MFLVQYGPTPTAQNEKKRTAVFSTRIVATRGEGHRENLYFGWISTRVGAERVLSERTGFAGRKGGRRTFGRGRSGQVRNSRARGCVGASTCVHGVRVAAQGGRKW